MFIISYVGTMIYYIVCNILYIGILAIPVILFILVFKYLNNKNNEKL